MLFYSAELEYIHLLSLLREVKGGNFFVENESNTNESKRVLVIVRTIPSLRGMFLTVFSTSLDEFVLEKNYSLS